MRWRQVVLLYVVLAALAAEYLLVERHEPPPATDQPVVRPRFLNIAPDDVVRLDLKRGPRHIVAAREAGRWRVIEPAGAAIASDLPAAFVEALTKADEIENVAAPTSDVRSFGFDEGAGRVELTVDGRDPVVIMLGGPNATGTAIYARRGDGPAIVLIGRDVRYYEDMLYQALPRDSVPAVDAPGRIGG